jgi:hypothetical protein
MPGFPGHPFFFNSYRMKTSGFRSLLLCLLTITVFSCTKDDTGTEELLVGKWVLTARSVDDLPNTLTECELKSDMEFRANSICVLFDACTVKSVNSGWSYRYGMLNISQHLPAAYYIDQLDESVLRIRRNDITAAGILQVTVLTYSRAVE